MTQTLSGGIMRDLSRIGSGFAKLGLIGAGIQTGFRAIEGLVGTPLRLAAEAEQVSTQFRVLVGSAEEAQSVLADLREFAAQTPLGEQEIFGAGRSLLAFKFDPQGLAGELRTLGDISAGVGMPLGELAEIYGKIRVQGRLFGEDINQLTGRGINVISELARQFGVAESEVKQLVTEGKVGFPQLSAAFKAMTGPGGQFEGMLQQTSQDAVGLQSTLGDVFAGFQRDIGEALMEKLDLKQVTRDAIEFGETMRKDVVPAIASAIESAATLAKAMAPVAGFLGRGFSETQGLLAEGLARGLGASDEEAAKAYGQFSPLGAPQGPVKPTDEMLAAGIEGQKKLNAFRDQFAFDMRVEAHIDTIPLERQLEMVEQFGEDGFRRIAAEAVRSADAAGRMAEEARKAAEAAGKIPEALAKFGDSLTQDTMTRLEELRSQLDKLDELREFRPSVADRGEQALFKDLFDIDDSPLKKLKDDLRLLSEFRVRGTIDDAQLQQGLNSIAEGFRADFKLEGAEGLRPEERQAKEFAAEQEQFRQAVGGVAPELFGDQRFAEFSSGLDKALDIPDVGKAAAAAERSLVGFATATKFVQPEAFTADFITSVKGFQAALKDLPKIEGQEGVGVRDEFFEAIRDRMAELLNVQPGADVGELVAGLGAFQNQNAPKVEGPGQHVRSLERGTMEEFEVLRNAFMPREGDNPLVALQQEANKLLSEVVANTANGPVRIHEIGGTADGIPNRPLSDPAQLLDQRNEQITAALERLPPDVHGLVDRAFNDAVRGGTIADALKRAGLGAAVDGLTKVEQAAPFADMPGLQQQNALAAVIERLGTHVDLTPPATPAVPPAILEPPPGSEPLPDPFGDRDDRTAAIRQADELRSGLNQKMERLLERVATAVEKTEKNTKPKPAKSDAVNVRVADDL